MQKLNLGCGEFKKKTYINVDKCLHLKPDIVFDLEKVPYPFKDNEFDLIEMDHVLEHIEDVFKTMKEIHRISNDNAEVIIRVPHFSRGFTHPEHKRGFDISFPYYFKPSFKWWVVGVKFKLKKMRLKWFAQPYLKKTIFPKPLFFFLSILGLILDFLANLCPSLCSRVWCYWVGGFEEIEYVFTKNQR